MHVSFSLIVSLYKSTKTPQGLYSQVLAGFLALFLIFVSRVVNSVLRVSLQIGLDEDTIRQLRKDNERITDRTYLIKDRNPIALVHILKNTTPIENRKENDPEILFALGLGFPNDGRNRQANYMVNVNELRNWVDITDEDDDDDID